MSTLGTKRDSSLINRRLRYLFLVLILLLPAESFFVEYMLYRTALKRQKEWLSEMVTSQVEIIEAVAKFDALHSQRDHQGGATGATISQVEDAFKDKGFGKTGEFVFAHLDAGKMKFDFPPRLYKGDEALVVKLEEKIPMREALLGRTGVEEGVDYRGVKVLAAYAPVPSLNSGIVAKIDLAELRKPYFDTFLITAGASSLLFIVGIFVFLGITRKIKNEISEREEAQLDVLKLRRFLSNIIDSMPSVLIGIDNEFRVTHWNRKAEKVTEINADNAIDKPITEVFPGIALESDEIRESIKNSKVKRKTNVTVQTEEGVQFEDLTVYPLVTNGVEGVVVRIDDVTKRHTMEEQLNQGRKLDAIGQLAGGVAHDFNNMLCGIMGAAEILKDSLKDPKDLEFIDIILQAARQSADLTHKLLAFGRKSNTPFVPIDVDEIIDDTISILGRTVDKKVQISENKEAKNTIINGAKSDIQNVLINLGINSANAMPDGGKLKIETSNVKFDSDYCEASPFDIEPGEFLKIDVRDNGCGIPIEYLQKIFEPFFTTNENGTGLGLAAAYGIVKDHNGAINVYSEEGEGTVFHVYFPCSDDIEIGENDVEEVEMGSGLILLVDDEKIVRKVGKSMLEKLGYDVFVAENGMIALEIFKEEYEKIDVVVLDMIMPDMNGREVFFKMKEIDNECKIVIASGFLRNEDIEKLKEKGLSGFIHKPFMKVDLSKILKEAFK